MALVWVKEIWYIAITKWVIYYFRHFPALFEVLLTPDEDLALESHHLDIFQFFFIANWEVWKHEDSEV